jgi:hypothetical protein
LEKKLYLSFFRLIFLYFIKKERIIKHYQDEYVDSDGINRIQYHSIDFYCNKIFSILPNTGVPKYPTLSKLVKNVLIISDGNAQVERGFSINSNIPSTEGRVLRKKLKPVCLFEQRNDEILFIFVVN